MTEVCPHEQCFGCTACASICPVSAISMQTDEWGFPYPHINTDKCVDCGACLRVCPVHARPDLPGLPEEVFCAAYHKDPAVRAASSSGGAFSALAETVLERGGHVCAAAFRQDYKSIHHIVISSLRELPRLRASKYMQSDLENTFPKIRDLLRKDNEVLFVGTPCQSAGLRRFLKKPYTKLTTVDIVCHGVPSPRIFADYINRLEDIHHGKVESYTFRDKKWSWYRFNMKATFSGGKSYYGFWESDPFFRGFLADLFLRDCCYRCPFSNHTRYSDITLSDFWGYWAVKDGFKDDDAGISMCMCNTVRGVDLLAAARHRLVIHPTEREASLANGGFNPREETIEGKYDFLSAYKKNGFPVLLGDYYRPAELPPEQKLLYVFGKGTVMLRISNRLLSLYRKARRRLYHLMRGKKK